MNYEKSLISITDRLESSKEMYSLICLKAMGLLITLNEVKCYLDGHYMLCLSIEDELTVNCGEYEAQTLHFLPYFYNVNLNHNVIGLAMYEEMRTLYGYPDFHLFRVRDERFFGILRLNSEEYEMAQVCFQRAGQHIDDHISDVNWSCRTRSDMISILRIAEGAYIGEQSGKGNEILRYIRDNLGEEITLTSLCKQFHTNRTTLTNIIKELTGMSPIQYVLEERLNHSRPDLLFTWVSIQEIAEKYGFDDTNYYIRAFKKRFGTTPLQYRHDGREERIRNETIYHERERKMMSVEDFNTYVRKGLGRAIVLLKEQTDKSIYRKPLMDFLTNDRDLMRYLGDYEVDLIDCFEDRDVICAEVAKALLSNIEKGDYRFLCIPLLLKLGYKDAVTEIIEREYQNAYAKLLKNLKQGMVLRINSIGSENYFSAVRSLAECLPGEKRIKSILFDIADLYQYTNRSVVATPAHFLRNIYGEDFVYRLLKEAEQEHPHGAKLRVRFKPSFEELKKSALPITAEEIFASSDLVEEDEEFERLYVSFLMADELVIREVAERILTESNIKQKLHLLRFFATAVMPDVIPPVFPLDPTTLVELAEKFMPTMYQEWYTQSIEGATRCFSALKWIRHPSVKALGKKILDDITCPLLLRKFGLELYYGVNYLPEDKDSFAMLLVHENLYNMFIDLIKTKTPGAPLDMVHYVYQAIEYDSVRYKLINTLIEIDALPKEIKDECQWDSYQKTRELMRI